MNGNDIAIFKTNVRNEKQANTLSGCLSEKYPLSKVNFDLDDSDNILRLEGGDFSPQAIIELLLKKGFQCSILE